MSTNLRNYTKAVYALDAVVQRAGAENWDNQSPCEEWSAREVLGHVIWHTTHAWDIAKATGQDAFIPKDLAQNAFDMVSSSGDGFRRPGILGPAVDVAGDADIVTRYMALSGRQV